MGFFKMIQPTLLYGFDVNPLIKHWNSKLHSVNIDGIRVCLLDLNSRISVQVDVCRNILPMRDMVKSDLKIEDYWVDKLGVYSTIARVLEDEKHLNSKVTFLKALRIESKDAMDEINTLGGSKFILRPISGTRSIDAFIINHTEERPFRLAQFIAIYQNLHAQRKSNGAICKDVIKNAFRGIGVTLLSDTTWQDFHTSKAQLHVDSKYLDQDHFFIQPFGEFIKEYRIIKTAPDQYFGYQYSDQLRGWLEDLKQVELKTLDELLGVENANELKAIFEDSRLPFMCSIDIGINNDGIIVHEYSPEFMMTEYTPRDLNILVESHLRGVIKHYNTVMFKPEYALREAFVIQ